MEMQYICTDQYGSHRSQVAWKVASAIEEVNF